MSLNFEGIIFSRPGESGIIPYIGSIWAAEGEKNIDNCKVWVSPSTSILISIFKIIGYSCLDILAFLSEVPQLANSPTPFKNQLNLGSDINSVREFLSNKIRSKIGLIPTLEELHRIKNVVLVGIGFSLSKQEIEYIHMETYPNMSVLDLICISLSTPGIYKPYKLNSDLWIDGSIIEPFSLSSIELPDALILAITCKPSKIIYNNKDPLNQVKDMIRTVFENVSDNYTSNITNHNILLVKIYPETKNSYLQLRNGWDGYMDRIKKEDITIHVDTSEAEKQD